MYDIWGTNENNVWAVGHSSTSPYRIWHWDGDKWQNLKPVFNDWVGLSHRRIFGFAQNDFWIVGGTSRSNYPYDVHGALIHYSDAGWDLYNPEGLPLFLCIWGTGSDNLYIGAYDGSVYHYNGSVLNRIETGIESRYACQVNAIWGLDENTVYAKASTYDTTMVPRTWQYYFIKIQNMKAALIDSFALSQESVFRFGNVLWGYDDVLFSGTGYGIFRYSGNQWQEELRWTTIYDIYGSSPNNIFAGAYGGGLFHFNGVNWKEITDYKSSGQTIWAIWCNDDHIFLIQDLGNYGQIVRGKRIKH